MVRLHARVGGWVAQTGSSPVISRMWSGSRRRDRGRGRTDPRRLRARADHVRRRVRGVRAGLRRPTSAISDAALELTSARPVGRGGAQVFCLRSSYLPDVAAVGCRLRGGRPRGRPATSPTSPSCRPCRSTRSSSSGPWRRPGRGSSAIGHPSRGDRRDPGQSAPGSFAHRPPMESDAAVRPRLEATRRLRCAGRTLGSGVTAADPAGRAGDIARQRARRVQHAARPARRTPGGARLDAVDYEVSVDAREVAAETLFEIAWTPVTAVVDLMLGLGPARAGDHPH